MMTANNWLVWIGAIGFAWGATGCGDEVPKAKSCKTQNDCSIDQGCSDGKCVTCTPALVGCACGSGSCNAGLVCDVGTDTCREAVTCAGAGCVVNQVCREAQPGGDAECLPECEGDWSWNGLFGQCEAVVADCGGDSPGSILADCDVLFRDCVELVDGATCGDCKTDYVEVDTACVPHVSCLALNCLALHRDCDELPNGHCTDCLPEFLEDGGTGECRRPTSCSETSCDDGWYCIEPLETADAYCNEGSCGSSAVLGEDGICHGCPTCNGATRGEAGPFLGGLTGEGKCICDTRAGFFWDEGSFPGVYPCDADQDGWVRESAKNAITATNSVIRGRAKCDLRSIAEFVLVADEHPRGQPDVTPEWPIPLSQALDMYETNRNDDQSLLDQAVGLGNLPAYGPWGRPLRAEELNSLTKACVTSAADFNENGLADLTEWHGNTSLGSVNELYLDFVDFVYFLELHRGWFEPSSTLGEPGRYFIREKSRQTSAVDSEQIALTYEDARQCSLSHQTCTTLDECPEGETCAVVNGFWRSCSRFVDVAFGTYEKLIGFDFAEIEAADDWTGMNHHSQFKCLKIVDRRAASDPPNALSLSALDAPFVFDPLTYQMNQCSAVGSPQGPVEGAVGINPWDPLLACEPTEPNSLTNGYVGWATVKYRDYSTSSGYTRGCVNECVEFKNECPGFDPEREYVTQCDRDPKDFGEIYCGCGRNYAGEDCTVACPDADLFVGPNFNWAPRTDYWMCGHLAATGFVDPTAPYLAEDLGATNIGYRLDGEIPAVQAAVGRLCQNLGGCGAADLTCDNTQVCVARAEVCDQVAKCDDGVDEALCGVCPLGFLQCGDDSCVSHNFVCDGKNDCADGLDEAHCVCHRGYSLQ